MCIAKVVTIFDTFLKVIEYKVYLEILGRGIFSLTTTIRIMFPILRMSRGF